MKWKDAVEKDIKKLEINVSVYLAVSIEQRNMKRIACSSSGPTGTVKLRKKKEEYF